MDDIKKKMYFEMLSLLQDENWEYEQPKLLKIQSLGYQLIKEQPEDLYFYYKLYFDGKVFRFKKMDSILDFLLERGKSVNKNMIRRMVNNDDCDYPDVDWIIERIFNDD